MHDFSSIKIKKTNKNVYWPFLSLRDTLLKTTVILSVLAGLRRSRIKGAFLLHPAAVIWHHLLLQRVEAYREGTPAPRHNPGRSMSTICLACCRASAAGKEWLQCLGLTQRDTVSSGCTLVDSSADVRPGQTPATEDGGSDLPPLAPWLTFLMSNIRPFDESRATGHEAEDMTAGNDEEWRIRKLINVGKGVKHLPLGMQSRTTIWINEAVFSSLWPAGQPTADSSIQYGSVMRCLSPGSTSSPLFQVTQSWMTRLWWDSTTDTLGIAENCPPFKKRAESGGRQRFGLDDFSVMDAIYLPSNLTFLLPLRLSLILQVSSHVLWNGVLIMVRWRWWCHSFAHFDLRPSLLTLLFHSFSIIWYNVSLICFLSCLFWHLNMEWTRKKSQGQQRVARCRIVQFSQSYKPNVIYIQTSTLADVSRCQWWTREKYLN